jgi:hypothetical protein
MPEKKPSEIFEFGDGIVAESSCLVAFISLDSEADMCTLYHVDVVTTIANRRSDGTIKGLVGLDEGDDVSLL